MPKTIAPIYVINASGLFSRLNPFVSLVLLSKMEEPEAQVRDERIRQFRDIVGDDLDEETCAALLSSNSWNVEATARTFFEDPNSPRIEPQQQTGPIDFGHFMDNDESEEDERVPFIDDIGGMRARRGGRVISPEREDLNFGSSSRNRSTFVPPAPKRSVISIVKEAITGQAQGESSSFAARRFAAEFDKLVGSDSDVPEFFESSFEDALLSASTDQRLLVAYLHSSLHPDSEKFCRDVLCSRPVLHALADARVWGGSVQQAEGYLASAKLQPAGFPCLVLITTERGRDAKIIDRLYVDDINEPNLAERIAMRINAARNYRTVATTPPQVSAVDHRVVDERRRVVEEQDAALRQAMEDDRRREEEKRAREREQEEEKKR